MSNTTSISILSSLHAAGITHLFVNLGSDHPALLDAFARKAHELTIVTSPNEMNALSAAHGFFQVTGRPAAVLVHVECGTQGMAGAVHNAARGRIPVVILAGMSPVTQEGELRGSRNEYIHWLQDVPDQRSIVKMYMKYDHEIRSGRNATQIIYRSLQFAMSNPKGPVYLVASRETLEEEVPLLTLDSKPSLSYSLSTAVEPIGLTPAALKLLTEAILAAESPLLITSYLGRNAIAFEALLKLADLAAIAVNESCPTYNNFSSAHWAHQGNTWNSQTQLEALAEADLIIVVDSDIPWIETRDKPKDDAKVFHLDCDPLKNSMTLWQLPAEKRWCVDSAVALEQLLDTISSSSLLSSTQEKIEKRKKKLRERFTKRLEALKAGEQPSSSGEITGQYFVSVMRKCLPSDTTILNESTSNLGVVADHLSMTRPLSLIGSGGSSLGWWSGAAVGAKMGLPSDSFVVAFVGDGTFLFGVPSCVYWMAKKYNTPFLTIVWNNGGWFSPKASYLGVYPEGVGKGMSGLDLNIGIQPSPEFGKIAEGAGGAWWRKVTRSDEVETVIKEAIVVVKGGRSALIEVMLAQI